MAENNKENLKVEEQILSAKEKQFSFTGKLNDLSKKVLDITKSIYTKTVDASKELAASAKSVRDRLKAEKDSEKANSKIGKLLEKMGVSHSDIKDALKEQFVSFMKIGAAVGASKVLLDEFLETQTAIGEEFGAIGLRNNNLNSTIRDINVEAVKLGYSVSDIMDTSTALSSAFGISLDSAFGLSDELLDTSKALGLSTDESVSLFGNLNLMGGVSFQVADNLLDSAVSMAMANKVAPQDVLKDIAGSTESFAKFSGDGGENILRAAIQAKKLGLNLDDVTGIAESLLDFQTSLDAEMNASLILGQQLNFQRARELALTNDLEGMMGEVVSQLGSERDLTKLNLIERNALASSINVSVEQLSKLINKEEESLTLAGALSKAKPFEELVGEDALNEFAIMINQMKSLGVTIGNEVLPPIMDLIRGTRSFIGGLKDTIGPMNAVIGVMSIMIGKSVGLAAGQLAIGLGKSFATGGIVGLVAGGLSALAAFATIQGLMAKGKTLGAEVSSAQDGANFITDGPMNMLVGDNVGGKEHVKVTPAPLGVNYDLEIRNNTKDTKNLLENLNTRIEALNTLMYDAFNPGGLMFRKQLRVTEA